MKKLLIANRGEIAVRVIHAAREMGIRSVAIYSDADKNAMHTALADEAFPIGASEPSASYLNMAKILEVAGSCGADAIHPGYGFLSERSEFSESCSKAGLRFVGPTAAAMRLLGSKIEAKKLAKALGVPIAPGFFESGSTPEMLLVAADEIGYPVMLKASAGGGGRGMRIVRDRNAFLAEAALASDEALKAFGDGAMMVEKLIERPRHIEVQMLADAHGSIACLYERECSLQRRHQKVIEEAPSSIGSPIWPKLKTAVERLAQASGYTNAGTVEFMFDEHSGEFYFLEVNARLQVEHPVTEAITGLDLVQWQLRIADGERLEFGSSYESRAGIHGHAIEARVVAEDPGAGFLPSIGRIAAWSEPKCPGVRVDTGVREGFEVSRYYDSLLAKVIAYGETRTDAIHRLVSALEDFHVLGVRTNLAYLLDVLRHPGFLSAQIDTGFLGREFSDWKQSVAIPDSLGNILQEAGWQTRAPDSVSGPWDITDGFRSGRAQAARP